MIAKAGTASNCRYRHGELGISPVQSSALSVVEEVQRRAFAKPLQLRGAEGVVEPEHLACSVCVLDPALDGLIRRHPCQPDEAEPIVRADAVIVRRILEGQRQQPLLFQIGLVNARKAASDNRGASQQARGQCRMLAAAAFAVIAVTDGHPFDPLRLVVAGDLGDRLMFFTSEHVDALPASTSKALFAPMNMLSLNLSRWPRKRSQYPAGEMWSVVVLPLVLISTGMSKKSLPSQVGQGSMT